MAIIVNGSALRTLNQPIYVGGTQIKQGFFNGTLCYPEDIPKGRYVLQLAGDVTQSFEAGEVTEFGSWSWWSGLGNTTYEKRHRSMFGHVETTIVSTKPIAVFNRNIDIDTSDLSSQYHAGTIYKYSNAIWGGGANSTPNGEVSRFPTLHASVSYQFAYDTRTSHDDSSVAECSADAHTCYAIWGFNTSPMNDYNGGAALTCIRKDSVRTDIAWAVAQNKEYVSGYHGVTTGPEFGLNSSQIVFDGYRADGAVSDAWLQFVISCGGGGGGWSPSLVTRKAICGYKLNVRLPAILGDMGSSGTPAQGNETSYNQPIAWVPFTKILYNNNPPISSPTFMTDPPTSEASDDLKAEIAIVHQGL